jgi:DNA-binding LacI/PurR family transcriptional regulator
VPDQVSVVGIDGLVPARYATPALTTVTQPHADIGEAAVRALLLGDGAPVLLASTLIPGETTGPPARRRRTAP